MKLIDLRFWLYALLLLCLMAIMGPGCTKQTPPPGPTVTQTSTSTSTATFCDCVVNPLTKEFTDCECGKKEDSPPTPAPVRTVKKPANCAVIVKGLPNGCPMPGAYGMIDMATYGTKAFYEAMACLDVHTIGRYYDWPGQETIKGKIPADTEVAIINGMGFSRLHVFQHNNNQLATFTPARGKIDAEKALGLASKWKQPKGSAVYFGVDGDFEPKKPLEYFAAAAPIIRKAGYRVGMYGSGANCEALKKAKLIDGDLCWIAASSWGWRGTKDILAKGRGFALKQKVNQKCMGFSLDYNTVVLKDFGQWRPE